MYFFEKIIIFLIILVFGFILIKKYVSWKYFNINEYNLKHERLLEIDNHISIINIDNKEMYTFIRNMDIDSNIDNEFADRLIQFKDNEKILKELKQEKRKIEMYFTIGNFFRNPKQYANKRIINE